MKIFQVADIYLPITPNLTYGGTERVVENLDREFTKKGEQSIVAAAGDSEISGRLFAPVKKSIWTVTGGIRETISGHNPRYIHQKAIVDFLVQKPPYENEKIMDVVHDHQVLTDSHEYYVRGAGISTPILVTLHGDNNAKTQDKYKTLMSILKEESRRKIFFNAISESQKKEFSGSVPVHSVIHHGIPIERYSFVPQKGKYLLSIGRIAPEKGQDIAIQISKKTGIPLVIAGEPHAPNKVFWETEIEPHIDGKQIKYVGPVNDTQKNALFGGALAFLMPIQWAEPFGLVMAESMAAGTPVVAFSRGSVPEIVKDGVSGFVIPTTGYDAQDLEEMINGVKKIESLDRAKVRSHVEKNFTAALEAERYLNLYSEITNQSRSA